MAEKQSLKDKLTEKFHRKKDLSEDIEEVVIEEDEVSVEEDNSSSGFKQRIADTRGKVVDSVNSFTTKTKDSVSDFTTKTKDNVNEFSTKTKENINQFSTKTKENIKQIPGKTKETITDKAQLTTDVLKNALESNTEKAKALLNDKERIEHFLMRLERKFKKFPGIGQELSYIPAMICLVKDYVDGEYRDIPLGSILGILSALIYFVSPFNLVPNAIPILGLTDDIALIAYVWRLVGDDVKEYEAWRKANHKELL